MTYCGAQAHSPDQAPFPCVRKKYSHNYKTGKTAFVIRTFGIFSVCFSERLFAIGILSVDGLVLFLISKVRVVITRFSKEGKAMLAPTRDRVTLMTDESVNEQIRRRTEGNINHYRDHPEEIPVRLEELDREWDVERVLEANASALSLAGITVAAIRNDRRWLVLPVVVGGFLLQHALQGWCPPVPLIRRLGVRTQAEIDEEVCALRSVVEELGREQGGGVGNAG
jgi:hypothetical protein